jgi:predicted Zn-dependent protease
MPHRPAPARHAPRPALLAAALLAGLAATGCTKNAATGETFFNLVSRDAEVQMGIQAAPQLTEEFGGKVNSPRLQAYVTAIGRKMAALTEGENPSLPWEFTLLDSPVINAFALPGGKVFISRGLLERMTNEAQLAGVLGHEIGHVTAQHTARRITQAQSIDLGINVAGAVVRGAPEGSAAASVGSMALPALNVGGQLLILKFGRDEESQADSLGMRYMSRAGYNPTGQLQVMQILKAASGGGGGEPEFLLTHPLPETRIQRITSLLQTEFGAQVANPQNQFYEDRFRNECLAVLRTLPPPTKKAMAEAHLLMAVAGRPCCEHP